MDRTTVAAVAVVGLLLIAGCNGLFGGDESPTTVTPAAVPTDAPTQTPTAPQLAPGLTDNGITNASALLAAHTAVLANRSFTQRQTTTGIFSNGSVIFHRKTILRTGDRGEGFYRRSTITQHAPTTTRSGWQRIEAWSNGNQTFVKTTHINNTTTYTQSAQSVRPDASRGPATVSPIWLTIPKRSLTPANSTVTSFRIQNGSHLYRVTSVAHTSEASYTIKLLVDARGVIHEYTTITAPANSERIVITSVRYTKIGTTTPPDRPAWVATAKHATAPNATTQQSR